tara:strand:+ start:5091 stop:8573 length:3483 start_codon:yes stop_codon:yes gene_type:complete
MAIIYSYPIVTPTSDDLILGTDVNADGKPTKNFTIQSIVDIVSGGAAGLGAVIKINSSAKDPATNTNQSATNFLNVQGTGTSTFNVFTDSSMTITGGVGTGFSSITSTDFAGNLTGVVKAGSSIQGTVTGVTQALGTNNTTLATTAFVQAKVDPSVLTFVGTSGGNQTVNLASQTFSILGTANQIESVGTAQKITFRFPTAGVTLPNGSGATTQAITDNSTKVATTAFVHSHSAAQDLDFSGDNGGTGSVLLDSQVFAINGTANQITTTQSGQSLTIAMPTNITVSGIVNATTFAGDLLGTINTVTTGVTQSAGNNSTKIATTAYVDNAAGSKTLEYAGDATGPFSLNLTNDDLEFNGDSNITITAAAVTGNKGIVTVDLNNNVTITGTSKAGTFTTTAGTATWTTTVLAGFTAITSNLFTGSLAGNASSATALATAGTISVAGDVTTVPDAPTYTSGGNKIINTTIADTVVTAKLLTNLPTPTSAAIGASDTILAAMAKLQGQITGIPQGLVYKGTWNANTNTPTLTSGTGVTGEFYIVSVAGNTNLNGITDWQVGDWAIFVEVGATDTWQKIDNTSAILGSGTANKIAKWTGSNTLATGLITDNGSTVTVGNSGNLVVEGNTTLGDAVTDTTTVKGPGVFEEALRINKGISLGASTYGSAGQVLTSGGGSASVNTWTTPTTGTVTSVGLTETGNALNITNTPITTSGNINIAGAGSASQYINGELNLVTFPTVDNYVSWTLAGDTGTSQTIGSTNTATFAGGFGISTAASATDTLTTSIDITGTDNAIAGLTAATPVATDTLWFNDISDSNTIRKATIADIVDLGNETLAEVLTNGNTTGGTDIAVSAADNITFTDTSKAVFGTGSDLEIYHDGSHSYIKDAGTGDLRLKGDYVKIIASNDENMLSATQNGAVELYYDSAKKFETTTNGVTVLGQGLLMEGTSSPQEAVLTIGTQNNTPTIKMMKVGSNYIYSPNGSVVLRSGGTPVDGLRVSSGSVFLSQYGQGNKTGSSAYDLAVNSSGGIIEVEKAFPYQKSGIFNGYSQITANTNAATLFTVTRESYGSLLFDVWITTPSGALKRYVIAHQLNSTPIYNKLLEAPGPGSSTSGITITFDNATSSGGTTGNSVVCKITTDANWNTTNVNWTVQVGYMFSGTLSVS